MKKVFYSILVCSVCIGHNLMAQPLAVGSTVADLQLKDIQGKNVSLYEYLNQGYTLLVDLSATWCVPCWNFEQTGVGQAIYDHYGPTGTVAPKKMMFLFIEGDPTTNANDLKGTGGRTEGDWITGKTHPIVDAPDWRVAQHFLVPGATQVDFPTFLMICPDKKVIWSTNGFQSEMNEAFLVEKMGTCVATGIENTESGKTFSIYPNPATNVLHLDMPDSRTIASEVSLWNVLGQRVWQQFLMPTSGGWTHTVDISTLPKGIYVVCLKQTDGSLQQQKFIKN